MTPPVVAMLHAWRLRLCDTLPSTREAVLQLFELPDPSDGNALQALGIGRLEIDSSISCVTVYFFKPVVFADIVAVFGVWTPVIRGPGNFHESPRGYTAGDFFSPRFTFYVQTKSVHNDAWEWIATEYCSRVLISLPNHTRRHSASSLARSSSVRTWWQRLWHRQKDQA
jgi:hypothetical protein